MTTGKRLGEFGKREPTPHSLAPKRSSHVALLVMGTLAVGGGAYALMPSQNCQPPAPPAPGMAVPVGPATTGTGCTTRTSSRGGGSSRYSFFSGSSYGGNSSSGGSTASGTSSGGVTRGGFGSFAHAFGFGGG